MEDFAKIVNGLRPSSIFTKNYVVDVSQGPECTSDYIIFQPKITCLKLTIETLDQGVKYVHS